MKRTTTPRRRKVIEDTYVYTPIPTPRPNLYPYANTVLQEQHKCFSDRPQHYGDFADNARMTVNILRSLGFDFPIQFSNEQVGALIHMAIKLARIPQSPNYRDSWLDLACYTTLGLAMNDRVQGRNIEESKE